MPALRTQSVPALDRGLSVLECLADSHHGLTLSQLTKTLDLPRSTVHCLLVTFERCAYIERDELGHRYRLGLRLFGLANLAAADVTIREEAAPFLRRLVERTHLTVHLAAFENEEAVLIAKLDPPGVLRPVTWVGKRMELHCTAVGKALLAYTDDAQVELLVRKHGLLRHNDNTIGSLRRLRQELELVRHRGYSVDDEEEEIGIRCVGAPVLHPSGQVRAAISVTGTTEDIDAESLAAVSAAVKEAAAGISERLGSHVDEAGHITAFA